MARDSFGAHRRAREVELYSQSATRRRGGSGGNPMRPRLPIAICVALTLITGGVSAAPRAIPQPAATSVECLMTPDTCCEAAPKLRDAAYAPFLGHPIAVVTFWN